MDLRTFLHVNTDLNDFQKDHLKKVVGLVLAGAFGEDFFDAIEALEEQAAHLEVSRFVPSRTGTDPVNRPGHYDRFPIEPTYAIGEGLFGFDIDPGDVWCLGNWLKYVCRYPYKAGSEDLRKAARYLTMYSSLRDGDPEWSR